MRIKKLMCEVRDNDCKKIEKILSFNDVNKVYLFFFNQTLFIIFLLFR